MTGSARELAVAVRDAVSAVPGVGRVGSESTVEVGTQYPGGKVPGVRLVGDTVEVHLVVDRLPLQPVVRQARAAARVVLSAAGDPRPVTIVVTDVPDDFVLADSTASLAAGATDVAYAVAAGMFGQPDGHSPRPPDGGG
ncbi:hypothetical protein [Phytohabitans kaempferiae]|uniref:Uncharacterized protein n=1 Tax=Phytohabitans kaempferiae TaxID=1620943 RepID=A0ABV6MB31_9ACTN